MSLLMKKSVIFAKVESTSGVDSSPDASNDAAIVYDLELGNEFDTNERDDKGVALGNQQELTGKGRMNPSMTTELRGGGAAGTAPVGDTALFKMCGLSETVSGGTSVTYAPRSAGFETSTIYANVDGVRHAMLGCCGNMEMSVVAGETAKLNWSFMAPWVAPTDVSVPTSYTPNTTLPPVAKNMTVSLDSYTPKVHSFNMNLNNVITERPDVNATYGIAGYQVTGRNVSAELVVEAVTLASQNYWSSLSADTTVPFSLVLGSVAGNIITLTATARIRNIQWAEVEGIATFTIPMQFLKSGNGNNEFSLVLT